MGSETMSEPISYYAARALDRAIAEWGKGIREPSGTVTSGPILSDYIAGPEGMQWTWERAYTNRKFQWCGAFVAYCWGLSLDADIRKYIMPSCSRIQGNASGSTPDRLRGWGPSREVPTDDIRPGDIMLVGKGKGSHITLVFAVDGDTIHTIEGNSNGIGVNGERYEGVVRHERRRPEAKMVIRMRLEDLTGTAQ